MRPGWPSLKMITADAPASCALRALPPKSHVPRWTSATLPAVNPAKSAASQPLVEVLGVGAPVGHDDVDRLHRRGDVTAARVGHA